MFISFDKSPQAGRTADLGAFALLCKWVFELSFDNIKLLYQIFTNTDGFPPYPLCQ